MDPVAALTRLGGIATAAELLELTTRKRLRRAVSAGRVVHVSRSRYALPSGDAARAVAVEIDGHLRLLSAATHWGWKVKWPAPFPQVQAAERPDEPVDAWLAIGVLPHVRSTAGPRRGCRRSSTARPSCPSMKRSRSPTPPCATVT